MNPRVFNGCGGMGLRFPLHFSSFLSSEVGEFRRLSLATGWSGGFFAEAFLNMTVLKSCWNRTEALLLAFWHQLTRRGGRGDAR